MFKSVEVEQSVEGLDEETYKILVVGDLAVGKTSLILKYMNGVFSEFYRATIGVDFALKELHWDPKTLVRLQLWDIAGQERYANVTRVYYREAIGALVVFDVTRASTFEAAKKWKLDIDQKVTLPNGDPLPVVLVANKIDLVKNPCNEELMNNFCKEYGFIEWFGTSAKENLNISESLNSLVKRVRGNEGHVVSESHDPSSIIRLKEDSKRSICCFTSF